METKRIQVILSEEENRKVALWKVKHNSISKAQAITQIIDTIKIEVK